jgi:hypothetical protein
MTQNWISLPSRVQKLWNCFQEISLIKGFLEIPRAWPNVPIEIGALLCCALPYENFIDYLQEFRNVVGFRKLFKKGCLWH